MKKQCLGITKQGVQCKRMIYCVSNDITDIYCKYHVQTFEKEDCIVCTEESNCVLSCGHWIHKECVIKTGKPVCPICRKHILMTLQEYNQTAIYNQQYKEEQIQEDEQELIYMYQDVSQIIQFILTEQFYLEDLEDEQELNIEFVFNLQDQDN